MRILALPGDGIGPEITAATLDVLAALDQRLGLGLEVLRRHGDHVRAAVVEGLVPPQVVWTAAIPKSFYGALSQLNADCAEEFPVADSGPIEPGTVMIIEGEDRLRRCERAYDRRVAGVVSGAGDCRPGIVLGKRETGSDTVAIALIGKVYCKADARYAPIEIGDLLTTSATPGHAMKASDGVRLAGAVIGKALVPLGSGTGLIPILVALQ